MNEKLRIELCSDTGLGKEPFYAELELPATAEQIRDAKQRARIVSADDAGSVSINIIEFDPIPELEEVRLDTTTVEELNYLAKRLDSLSDEQFIVYRALFDQRFGAVDAGELLSVKDLINMTYDLDSVMIASNIRNDEQLGQFVIENDLHPDVAAVPEGSLYLLDKRRIGELQRQNDGGVFWDGFYVIAGDYEIPNIYDGHTLPVQNDANAVFRLAVAEAPYASTDETKATAEWICLPISHEEADRIAQNHNECCIEDCVYFGFESAIPQITSDVFGDMLDFTKLNAIAERYLFMSNAEQIKFKAILEAENISKIEETLKAADRLNEYELSYLDGDAASFFKSHICHNLDVRFDDHWLDTLLTQNEGKKLIERLGASVTAYGILSARGGQLFEPVTVEAPEAKELKTQAMTDEKLEVVEVLGQTALFTNGRVTQKELPDGLYKYDLREGESIAFATIEPSVAVNHAGTIITKEPIVFGDDGYIELDEDDAPCFTGEEMSIEEFLNSSFDEAHENTEELGGMKL